MITVTVSTWIFFTWLNGLSESSASDDKVNLTSCFISKTFLGVETPFVSFEPDIHNSWIVFITPLY